MSDRTRGSRGQQDYGQAYGRDYDRSSGRGSSRDAWDEGDDDRYADYDRGASRRSSSRSQYPSRSRSQRFDDAGYEPEDYDHRRPRSSARDAGGERSQGAHGAAPGRALAPS